MLYPVLGHVSYYASHSTRPSLQKPKKLWEFLKFPTPPINF